MSAFRAWLNNPNVHLWTALALGIMQAVPVLAPFAPIMQSIGLTLTATGALLPESGSLHQADYLKLADTISTAIANTAKTVESQGRA